MRQYTTPEQTAKLIELGFEKPKSISSIKVTGNIITTAEDLIGEPSSVMGGKITANYSIGELIEFCPRVIGRVGQDYVTIEISHDTAHWIVGYTDFEDRLTYAASSSELIDAVFNMIVKLKEKGLI